MKARARCLVAKVVILVVGSQLICQQSFASSCSYLKSWYLQIYNAIDFNSEFERALKSKAPSNVIGFPESDVALDQLKASISKAYTTYRTTPKPPRPQKNEFGVDSDLIYFAQSRGAEINLSTLKKYFGSGYEKEPILIEIPLEGERFVYIVFDGHHRIAADFLHGASRIDAEIWSIPQMSSKGISTETVSKLIDSISKHLVIKS